VIRGFRSLAIDVGGRRDSFSVRDVARGASHEEVQRTRPQHIKPFIDKAQSIPDTARDSKYARERITNKSRQGKLYQQDGNGDAMLLDSLLGRLTDAPIQQTKPAKRQLEWDSRRAMAFGLDCAGRVLDVFRTAYPEETSVPLLYVVARKWLDGEAQDHHLDAVKKRVTTFAQSMEEGWSAAGEAAGAVWGAVTGKIGKAAESARNAAFGRATGTVAPSAKLPDIDPAEIPGGLTDDSLADVGGGAGGIDHLLETNNTWERNKKFALKLHQSDVLLAEARERDWQLERLREYLHGDVSV